MAPAVKTKTPLRILVTSRLPLILVGRTTAERIISTQDMPVGKDRERMLMEKAFGKCSSEEAREKLMAQKHREEVQRFLAKRITGEADACTGLQSEKVTDEVAQKTLAERIVGLGKIEQLATGLQSFRISVLLILFQNIGRSDKPKEMKSAFAKKLLRTKMFEDADLAVALAINVVVHDHIRDLFLSGIIAGLEQVQQMFAEEIMHDTGLTQEILASGTYFFPSAEYLLKGSANSGLIDLEAVRRKSGQRL